MDSVRFIDVRDVAAACLASRTGFPAHTFNVCTQTGKSIGELVALVLRLLGSERDFCSKRANSSDDIPFLVGSPDRLRTLDGSELSLITSGNTTAADV